MNVFRLALVSFVLLVLANADVLYAQNQQREPYGKTPDRTITAHPSANNPKKAMDETDQNFMREAAIGNQAEIQLGQMAQEKSGSPEVKSFGQRMVKDHSDTSDKLKNIAESQHISLPVGLDPQHKDVTARLSRLSGPQFDQAYMQLMVQEHTKDVDKFKKEAADAHDDTVKQFAAASLPILQSHLNEAQQVEQQLNTK
jgi:putative membrane protein